MYDYWMIIVGGVFGVSGLWGLLTGSTTIYYRSRPGWGGQRPLFTYQGRGLALVETIMGGLLVGLYLLSRGPVERLPPIRANSYAGIVFVAGLGLGILLCVFQGVGSRRAVQGHSQKEIRGISLSDAAAFLKMPESELLQMAQNGGIAAHYANESYVFHPDVLRSFQEAMASLN